MIVTLDFETYFGADFTLSKMSTSEYIRDERFKVHMAGIKIDDQPTKVYATDEIPAALAAIDWTQADLLCHHTAFDGFIIQHHYGVDPRRYLCTLSMARGAAPALPSYKLGDIADTFGLGQKMANRLQDSKGIETLDPAQFSALAEYCVVDVDLTYAVWEVLKQRYPQSELELIDLTMRMFCQPVLQVDTALAQEELEEEIGGKVAAVLRSGVSAAALMSNNEFAGLLQEQGVAPPVKVSKTTGKLTYAFAKDDPGLRALLHHPSEIVKDIVQARLKVKSTIGETRARRLLEESKDGPLPIYLHYYGAHTGRWSGGNKMNPQNLPRPEYNEDGTVVPGTGRLRRSLLAPKGHVLCVADSAQIEARTTAWYADEHLLLTGFAEKRDIYCEFASLIFKRLITKADKKERFVGKTCILGLGFGMGPQRLRETLLIGGVDLTLMECQAIIDAYRETYQGICELWKTLEKSLHTMLRADKQKQGTLKCLTWLNNPARIHLPNNMFIQYPGLYMGDNKRFSYDTGKGEAGLWGGTVTENVVQATARIIVADHMRTIAKRYRVVTMTHDEIVCSVPSAEADEALQFMFDVMKTPPAWAPDLPLGVDGGYDVCYSK